MLLRNCFIFIYLCITVFLFATLESSVALWMSFFVNALILTFIAYYHIFIEKRYSPFLSTYIVFNYLFFLVAPMSQLGTMMLMETPMYTHKFPYSPEIFIKTNVLISLFHIVFFIFYVGVKQLIRRSPIKKRTLFKTNKLSILYLFVFLSIVILIVNGPFLIDEYSRPGWLVSEYSKSYLLITKKVFFIVPLAGVVLSIAYLKNTKITQHFLLALISLAIMMLILLVLKNPFTEKRNALGPIYLLLLFLFYPKLVNSNVKTTFLLFFAMVVAFPAFQFFTHLDYGFVELINKPSLIFKKDVLGEGYMSLNYDAFINIGVVIEIVETKGFSYGFQSLSALLFFIPRSLWTGKPDSSGQVVGDYLIDEYDFWFANLSNPLVSEGYMNFGVFGVAIMAFLLAVTIVYLMTWLNSTDYLKKSVAFYFAMHMIFLLRGDFTNGYSYFMGTLIGLYIIPKFMINMYDFIFKQKTWVLKRN